MKTVDYARLAESSGINADAEKAFAMRGDGDIEARISATRLHWDARPLTTSPPNNISKDYTGTKRGKLVCVGYYGRNDKKGSLWLVKCACGKYEIRLSKALRNSNQDDMCERCYYIRHVKRVAYFNAYGRYPE